TRNDATRVLDVDYRLGPPRISVESVIASSHSDAYPEARAVDGRTSTFWGSAGNSQLPYYRDDDPEITFVFDSVRPLGMMRISNLPAGDTYNTRRGVKRMMILVSTDGSNFTEVREVEVARSAPGVQAFQQIDLEGVSARAVKFDIKSSWFTEFENGSSYEEQPYPNESIVGFAEVEFYAVGATTSDVLAIPGNQVSGPFSTGTAHFDAGQSTATITVTPSGIHRVNQPPKTLELN